MVLAITVVSSTFAGQVLASSMLVPPAAASGSAHGPTTGSGAITLQADQVVFKAYGLTNGLNWSVKLDRVTESSNVTLVGSTPVGIITFFGVAPGLHNYSVGPVTGYGATPFLVRSLRTGTTTPRPSRSVHPTRPMRSSSPLPGSTRGRYGGSP